MTEFRFPKYEVSEIGEMSCQSSRQLQALKRKSERMSFLGLSKKDAMERIRTIALANRGVSRIAPSKFERMFSSSLSGRITQDREYVLDAMCVPKFPNRISNVLSPAPRGPRGKKFDADLFHAMVAAHLGLSADHYSYAIAVDNILVYAGAEGFERITIDLEPGEAKKTDIDPVLTRLDIASMSKTVTAVAVIRLLLSTSTSLDDEISEYLPPESWGWGVHPDLKSLTFRKLLTHTSGSSSAAISLQSVRKALQSPADIEPNKYAYANFNYAMLRVLSYRLLGGTYVGAQPADAKLEVQHGAAFCEYVRTAVLAPSGIVNATWGPAPGRRRALVYPWPTDLNAHGVRWTKDNGEIWAGSSALHLSSVEMIGFLLTVPKLLSNEWIAFMQQDLAGIDNRGGSGYGKYYGHGGALFLPQKEYGHTISTHSQWLNFPENSTYIAMTATSSADLTYIENAWSQFYIWAWIAE